jgi:E3 ubiquitin-protein ligase CHFR
MIGRLVSINPSKVQDIDLTESPIILGRNSNCNVKLDDNRCSSNHCKVIPKLTGNQWTFDVEDLSTNGTFLKDEKVFIKQIGKGKIKNATWGDQINILRYPQVDENSKIGFVFQEIAVDKRKNGDSTVEKKLKEAEDNKNDKNNSDMSDKLGETIKCQICMEVMYQPVSLYPCLHNFCGGCFSDWNKRADDCPSCRTKVTEVKKNHMVFSLIDMYLKSNPQSQRPQEELDELDAINNFKQDRAILKKNFKSDGSASSDEEETKAPKRAPKAPIAVARPRPGPGICKQCKKQFEGYKCLPNQVHIQCTNCSIMMPDRLPSQKCTTCTRPFCNLYWRGSKCRIGVNTVDSYVTTTFTNIRPTALNENKFEHNVLADYIRKKRLNFKIVAEEMLDSMELNKWNINLSKI